MTPADLRAWLAARGYTNYRAAKELGVTATTVANWLDGTSRIDRRTALACAALAAGLVPWAFKTAVEIPEKVVRL